MRLSSFLSTRRPSRPIDRITGWRLLGSNRTKAQACSRKRGFRKLQPNFPINGMSRSTESERLLPMKKPIQHFIAEVPRSSSRVGMTIGIDLGDVWSHYCTLNEDGEVVGRGRFRTSPSGVEKWFTGVDQVVISGSAVILPERCAVRNIGLVNDSGFIKTILLAGNFYEGLSLRQSQLGLLNHLQPQRIRIGIEYCGGVCRKNEPRAQLHLLPQLILRPSGISQVNVKNLRVRPGRNCFF
jgi:hypothetical protein